MRDFIFPATLSDNPTHRIIRQGMIYDIIHFLENPEGDGGSFTALGMCHDTPKPPLWELQRKDSGFKQNIQILHYEDASDIPIPNLDGVRKTSCDFVFL